MIKKLYNNYLTLIKKLDKQKEDRYTFGIFKCICGNEKILPIYKVFSKNKNNIIKSCGCLKNRTDGIKTTKGDKRVYLTWRMMMARCYQSGEYKTSNKLLKFLENKKPHKSYSKYGGKGIKVCEDWHDITVFKKWYNKNIHIDQTIDRKDNRLGYTPQNCRGATKTEQNLNRGIMSNNKTGYNGVTITKNGSYKIKVKYMNKSYEKSVFKNKHEALIHRNLYIIKNNLPHRTQCLDSDCGVNFKTIENKLVIEYLNNGINTKLILNDLTKQIKNKLINSLKEIK